MDVETLLREEIAENLEILKKYGEGTDEHKKTTDDAIKLIDRLIDFEKLKHDSDEVKAKLEFEREKLERDANETKEKLQLEREKLELDDNELKLKTQQFEEDKKDRLIKNIIAIAGIIVPVCLTVWGTLKSFEFEKEGTITTTMGRGFMGRLFPKK